MSPHERALATVLEALDVRRDGTWTWFGAAGPRVPGDGELARAAAAALLRERLYTGFYVHGSAVPDDGSAARPSPEPGPFAARLAASLRGRTSLQPGWRVCSLAGGMAEVMQGGLRAWARADELEAERGGPPEVGAPVEVRVPAVLEGAQPGCVLLQGRRAPADAADIPIDRVYWHIRAGGAAPLAAYLVRGLDDDDVPFRLKLLADPGAYRRCDAAVLYAPRARREAVVARCRAIRGRVGRHLGGAVPALTLRLDDGIALAEDPPGGESFGLHRCGLLARALLDAGRAGARGRRERMDAVARGFAAEGIDLAQPWRAAA